MVCLTSGVFLMHCSRSLCSSRLSLTVLLSLNQLVPKMMNLILLRKVDLSLMWWILWKVAPLCYQAYRLGLNMKAFADFDRISGSVAQRSWPCYVMFLDLTAVPDSLWNRQVFKLLYLVWTLLSWNNVMNMFKVFAISWEDRNTGWTTNICIWWQQVCAC